MGDGRRGGGRGLGEEHTLHVKTNDFPALVPTCYCYCYCYYCRVYEQSSGGRTFRNLGKVYRHAFAKGHPAVWNAHPQENSCRGLGSQGHPAGVYTADVVLRLFQRSH